MPRLSALAVSKLATDSFSVALMGSAMILPMIGMRKAQQSILKAVNQELIDENFISQG